MPLYEYEEGTSRKFYRIDLDGRRVHLHWGRIGYDGEHQILTFASEAEARAEYDRQRIKRTGERGYTLVVDDGAPHDAEALERERLAKVAPLSDEPRFLFAHRRRRLFAWVEARKDLLISAAGPITDEATTTPTERTCGSPAAAVRARDARVAELLADGYELDTFGVKAPAIAKPKRIAHRLVENAELEAAVAEDVSDDNRWSVLEDWLLQQPSDPRGELVLLEKGKHKGDAAQLRGELLPVLYGDRHRALSRAIVDADWRAGYLRGCKLAAPAGSVESTLGAFLAAPAARLLGRLEIAVTAQLAQKLCTQIGASPCARALRELVIGPRLTKPLTLDARIFVLPRLSRLAFTTPVRLSRPDRLAHLATLELFLGDTAELDRIAAATLGLRELVVETRILEDDDETLLAAFAPIFAGIAMPQLERLIIRCPTSTATAVLAALATSPLLPRLRAITLGTLPRPCKSPPGFEHVALALPA